MAFDYFAKEKVDIAIVEVGLGGRLDSTNIIQPELSIITNIGLDHTQFLGTTLVEVASEKAGIIKQNTPVVIGELQEEIFQVFQKKASDNNAEIFIASKNSNVEYQSDLKGGYQVHNIKTVVQAINVLQSKGYNISEENLVEGLNNVVKNTGLLGRWQQLSTSPRAFCDTGHNKEGLLYVLKQLEKQSYNQLHFVFGVVNDKDLTTILDLFPKKAMYYFCKPDLPRGLDPFLLSEQCKSYGLEGKVYNSVKEAYSTALSVASNDDFVFVGGSTFVVAEVV